MVKSFISAHSSTDGIVTIDIDTGKILTDREKMILWELCFGYSIEDVAKGHNVTKERICQIRNKAFKKLGITIMEIEVAND